MCVKRGTFLHVATYSPDDGLQRYRSFGSPRTRSRKGEPEKRWPVDALRALGKKRTSAYDPQEVYVWAATHGWAMKDAKRLQEIAEGVRQGKNFQGYDRCPIPRDRETWRRMIEQWDKDIAEEDGDGEALADTSPDEHRADGGAHVPPPDVRALSTERWALSQAVPLSRLRGQMRREEQ
jgi:hypothetical protein